VQPQLFPPVLSAAQTQFHASPPPSPRGEAAAADPSLDERERDLPDEQTLLARATTLAAPSSAPVSSGASSDRPPAIQRATTTPSSSDLDEHKHAATVDAAPVVTDAYMLTPVSAGGTRAPSHLCSALALPCWEASCSLFMPLAYSCLLDPSVPVCLLADSRLLRLSLWL